MGRLLIWISGASPDILRKFPGDRPKYIGIGAAVLITAGIAAMSMTFALVTALQVPLPAAIPFALVWGLAILSLDRWLVVSLQRQPHWWGYLTLVLPRVLLGILFGIIISTPFVLQIFAPDITREINQIHNQAAATYFSQLKNSPLTKRIAAERGTVRQLQATISAKGGAPVDPYKTATVRSLQQQLSTDQSKANRELHKYKCELEGVPGVCRAGPGPIAHADHAQYLQDKAQVRQDKKAIAAAVSQARHASNAQRAKNLLFAQSSLPPARQALNADVRLQKAQTASFTKENASSAGLLFRLQALGKATARDATLNGARLLLLLFFTVIECLPIGVKVLLLLGPENAYERAFAKDERAKLRAAEHESRQQEHARILEADIARDEEARLLQERETRMDTVVRTAIDAEEEAALAAIREWKLGQLAAIAESSYLQPQAAPPPGKNGTTLAGRLGPFVSPPTPGPGPGPARAGFADPATTAAVPGYDPVISGGGLPGEDVAGNGAPPGSTIFPAVSPPRQPLDTAPVADQQPAGWFRVPPPDNAGPPWDFRGAEDTATRAEDTAARAEDTAARAEDTAVRAENQPHGIGTAPGSAGTAGDAGPRGAWRPEAPPDSGQPE